MPIEIRELVVRARIDPGEGPAFGDGSAAGRGGRPADGERHEEWAGELVREALRAIADRQER